MKILLHATLKPAFHNIIIFKKHIMITIELSRSLVFDNCINNGQSSFL